MMSQCERCNFDTSEYEARFARWCGACRDEAEAEGVFFDLEDRPYRNPNGMAWLVSECCWAFATGTEDGPACRACHELTYHLDQAAKINRFGRAP